MEQHSEVFVGVDAAKLRHAVAVAEDGRRGEVRYIGEVGADTESVRRLATKLEKQHGVALEDGFLASFGDRAASGNLRSSRSRPARPYIWRLKVSSRLICPSVWPLLQSSDTAARTAAPSVCRRLANRRSAATGPS